MSELGHTTLFKIFLFRNYAPVKENAPLEHLKLVHFVLPFAILTGGISLATLVFILELFFQKERQNGIVKPLALENDSNTNDKLPNPDSATVLTYSVTLILFRFLMSLLIEGSAVMCVKTTCFLVRIFFWRTRYHI